MNYKIALSYDGTNFYGSSIQKENRTIQYEIEKAISIFFKTPIKVILASRTDRFVHAKNQILNFRIDKKFVIDDLLNFLNNYLENDILIKYIKKVSDNFHARFDCVSKTYLYIISFKKEVFKRNYEWFYYKDIDLKKLKNDSNYFIGTHNFLSFSTSKLDNTIRTINWIKFSYSNKKLKIYINGNGFLRSMIRMIIGTLIYENKNSLLKEKITYLLNNPLKGKSSYKAPGHGLYLYKIYY